MRYLLSFVWLGLGLALPAHAATYYADDVGGGGNTCTSGSPCTLSGLITKLAAGDTGIVRAGTYGGILISGKNGTASSRITLRGENPAVSCPDPVNDPDGCVVANTSSRSVINASIDMTNSDFWTLDGLQLRKLRCDSDSINAIVRYFHFFINNANIGNRGRSVTLESGCDNWLFEHGYFTKTDDLGGDYGTSMYQVQNTTLRNIYYGGGNLHHAISIKRGGIGYHFERIVCEGHEAQCIMVGQEMDDGQYAGGSPTSCRGTALDDGSAGNIVDHTVRDVTIRDVFGRNAKQSSLSGGTSLTRSLIHIDNANNVTAENVFAKVGGYPIPFPIWIRNVGTAEDPGGRCGVERGNISFRGVVVDAAGSSNGCVAIASLGESPAPVTLENVVCHNASSGSDNGIVWGTTNSATRRRGRRHRGQQRSSATACSMIVRRLGLTQREPSASPRVTTISSAAVPARGVLVPSP